MPHIIRNKHLEVQIDLPTERYNFSRFDWSGKIAAVYYDNIPITTLEAIDGKNEHQLGKAFYNEFGIDSPLGFEEAADGDWFHKIGVGLLKKDDPGYGFDKKYQIRPARFSVVTEGNRLLIRCTSEKYNGYSYDLTKTISVAPSSFSITYLLLNTGEKTIITDEYVHNFLALNNAVIGPDYNLKFPFELHTGKMGEIVNPENKVKFGKQEISFLAVPEQQFFASHLAGATEVNSKWELINEKERLGIRESTNFRTPKINLWGTKHVISPELFFDIHIAPGKSARWVRSFTVFTL